MKGLRNLESYFEESKQLSLEEFGKQHGSAFLLHHGPIGGFKLPEENLKSTIRMEGSGSSSAPFDPKRDFVVFPVRNIDPGATEADLIWVGRSEENDIMIPDESVSAVHAFIRKGTGGILHLQDMNSMNGTFTDSEKVPSQGMGEPVELMSGARLRFGAVKLTFLKAPEFLSLVKQLCS